MSDDPALVDRMALPAPYRARRYRGPVDHPAMNAVLTAHRARIGDLERPSVDQIDRAYGRLSAEVLARDVVIVERGGEERGHEVVAYARPSVHDLVTGARHGMVFAPTHPDHVDRSLFEAMVTGEEDHLRQLMAGGSNTFFRADATHPGPDREADAEAAWLEALGYRASEWGAVLRRPHLDDLPDRALPDGVELRPVVADDVREILHAYFEAFRDEWGFEEPNDGDFEFMTEHPRGDTTLWKVAWAGDEVVGQVKAFIDHEANGAEGIRRGHSEYIATHRDWRNQGIAGALLVESLRELRERGMTEAVLGVDTNNPGGAFQLYTGLGFELQAHEAVYLRPTGS